MRFCLALILGVFGTITPAWAELTPHEAWLFKEATSHDTVLDRQSKLQFLETRPAKESGAWVRQLYWSDKFEAGGLVESVTSVLGPMLETVNGCILPVDYCAELRDTNLFILHGFQGVEELQLLSTAMQIGVLSDCDPSRQGIVESRAMSTGHDNFVVFSTSTDDDAACFVRKVGT